MYTWSVTENEMTVKQAADMFGVTRRRVHALIEQGQLTAERRESEVGVPFLVLKREEVERLAEERRRIAVGEAPPRGGGRPKAPPRLCREHGEE